MRWKTLEEELPDYGREIFAKIQSDDIECYVLIREKDRHGKDWRGDEWDSYVEALGERYMSFESSEIIGWVYVDDLQEMLDKGV